MFETSVCPLYLPIFSCSHCLRLNRTITELLTNETISSEEFGNLSVVVKLPPFAEPNSFIVQVKGNAYGIYSGTPSNMDTVRSEESRELSLFLGVKMHARTVLYLGKENVSLLESCLYCSLYIYASM